MRDREFRKIPGFENSDESFISRGNIFLSALDQNRSFDREDEKKKKKRKKKTKREQTTERNEMNLDLVDLYSFGRDGGRQGGSESFFGEINRLLFSVALADLFGRLQTAIKLDYGYNS